LKFKFKLLSSALLQNLELVECLIGHGVWAKFTIIPGSAASDLGERLLQFLSSTFASLDFAAAVFGKPLVPLIANHLQDPFARFHQGTHLEFLGELLGFACPVSLFNLCSDEIPNGGK
jgi:hypothetical protein